MCDYPHVENRNVDRVVEIIKEIRMKTIIKKMKGKKTPWALILRSTLQDRLLSWKARGLLAYVLSLPDNWQIYMTELSTHSTDGVSATRAAMRELIKRGYVHSHRIRGPEGKYQGNEYLVFEEPHKIINIDDYLNESKQAANETRQELFDRVQATGYGIDPR